MAEQERKTKAERRAEARAERKRAEEEARKQARKDQVRNTIVTVAIVLVVGVVLVAGSTSLFGGGESVSTVISQEAALQARADAGCETIVNEEPLPDSTHHEIASAPAADAMYGTTVRPNHSGPHYSSYSEPFGGAPRDPADERSLTHNLEHGAIIVWVDEAVADDGVLGEIEDWVRSRMDMGYTSTGGGHIFVSKYNGITSGKPIALRAWGVAVDCDEWSPLFADSFVIDYFGTHGNAPERPLSPYPQDALGYGDPDADASETATDGVTTEPTEPTEGESTAEPTDEPATEPTGDASEG